MPINWGHPHRPPSWSCGPLAWGCELHPNTHISLGLPKQTLLHCEPEGSWEQPALPSGATGAPQDHPAHPCSSPGQAAEGPGSHLRTLRDRITGMPGCTAHAPGAGNLGHHCRTGSDRQQRATHPSQLTVAGSCPQKKLASRQAGVRGEPPTTAGTGGPAPWWRDATDSNSWYLPPRGCGFL